MNLTLLSGVAGVEYFLRLNNQARDLVMQHFVSEAHGPEIVMLTLVFSAAATPPLCSCVTSLLLSLGNISLKSCNLILGGSQHNTMHYQSHKVLLWVSITDSTPIFKLYY